MKLLPAKIMTSTSTVYLIMSCLIFPPVNLSANEGGEVEAGEGEESHHKHALALFVGITREHDENLETLGIEYAYRINKRWSVGGVVERADREEDSTLVIVFAHYWLYKGLYFGGGIGRKDPTIAYLSKILKDKSIAEGIQEKSLTTFVISESNFSVFLENKSVSVYLKFYNKFYLGKVPNVE